MAPEETAAVERVLWEQFQLKADLAFERECVERALSQVRSALSVFAAPAERMKPEAKVDALATILDCIEKDLKRRRER